ncbi:MAG: glycoside hydrolase domain-containing protein [Candidatus Cybelea sp.]
MANLPGVIRRATPAAKGFDTAANLSPAAIAALAKQFQFCVRYVPWDTRSAGDLTSTEATNILQAGLALMPIYPYPGAGWQPDDASGLLGGKRAAAGAESLGFPKGVNLWMDLEGVAPGWPAASTIDHCNNWFDVVEAAGYVPGIYVGEPVNLTGEQLFSSLKFDHYWRSLSGATPDIPTRGYQMLQSAAEPIAGISIDSNVAQRDSLGGNAQWLVIAHEMPEAPA